MVVVAAEQVAAQRAGMVVRVVAVVVLAYLHLVDRAQRTQESGLLVAPATRSAAALKRLVVAVVVPAKQDRTQPITTVAMVATV